MTSGHSLSTHGQSGHLIVPVVAIPTITIGAFTYFRDHLPEFCVQNAEKVIGTAFLLTLAFLLVAWFRRSRTVAFAAGQLRYHSWLTDKSIAASQVTNMTFETELSGSADQTTTEHYLSLWSGNDLLVRFNSAHWPQDGLAPILRAIQQHNPTARIDRSVDKYMARS